MRIALVAIALLSIAGFASAQDDTDDPFATADDPFATADDPFAALEANVSEAEETLGAAVEDAAVTSTEEEETAPAPTPTPAPAAAPPESAPAKESGNDTPGFELVALLGAAVIALAIIRRK